MTTTTTTTTNAEERTASFSAVGPRFYCVQFEFLPDAACYVSSGIRLFSSFRDACDWVHSQKRLAHAGISDICVEVRQ